jgi:hypothetical protein
MWNQDQAETATGRVERHQNNGVCHDPTEGVWVMTPTEIVSWSFSGGLGAYLAAPAIAAIPEAWCCRGAAKERSRRIFK